jgi:hypothetical protein
MKTLMATGALIVLAVPAFAEEEAATAPRLSELETIVITTIKEEPATSTTTRRLEELETFTITAIKEQPKEHDVDSKTATLLAELEKQ